MRISVNSPNVFIIVLNWNGWRDTNECIASLRKLDYPNFHILVVDNGSSDESATKIQDKFPNITFLQMSDNKGYAGGNNEGIRYAMDHGADYIWILNNDTVVEPAALTPLVQKMEEDPMVGMCGSLLKDYHNQEQTLALSGGRYYKWLGITRRFIPGVNKPIDYDIKDIEQSLDFIAGAALFVSRVFVNSIGLMNEQYFLYYEEVDWAVRNGQTYTLGFAPESIVYHKMGASVNSGKKGSQKRSKLADYYQIKNRLKFTRKYYGSYLPAVYLTVIYAVLNRLLRGEMDRAWMILKLMFTCQK